VEWLREPLVPVTDTEYLPGVELEQVRVAVPGEGGRETLVGLTEQLLPQGDEAVRLTVPVKLVGLTVTAYLPVVPVPTV
jgi:hypothetical protein